MEPGTRLEAEACAAEILEANEAPGGLVVRDVVEKDVARRAEAAVHHEHHAAGGVFEARLRAGRTMSAAQALYEGRGWGEGLITYMRTDGLHVSPEAVAEIRAAARAEFGPAHVPAAPNAYRRNRRTRRRRTRRSGPPRRGRCHVRSRTDSAPIRRGASLRARVGAHDGQPDDAGGHQARRRGRAARRRRRARARGSATQGQRVAAGVRGAPRRVRPRGNWRFERPRLEQRRVVARSQSRRRRAPDGALGGGDREGSRREARLRRRRQKLFVR
jgi:hypothetical protein